MRRTTPKSAVLAAAALLLAAGSRPDGARAANFSLSREIAGNDFFDQFWWWDAPDPTHGYVDYLSQSAARSQGLAYVDSATGRFVMRAGTGPLNLASVGRPSNRIQSKFSVEDGLVVAKISYMPTGCGTWPAFWTCGAGTWPDQGEIDILEGANDVGTNIMTLHTQDGCSMSRSTASVAPEPADAPLYSGTLGPASCAFQPGCGISAATNASFGPTLNANGGGYFAMLRDIAPPAASGSGSAQQAGASNDTTPTGISVWFWPAGSSPPAAVGAPTGAAGSLGAGGAPAYVLSSEAVATWGVPQARFVSRDGLCDLGNFFGPHQLIFDLTYCGDWAGQTFNLSPGCPKANNLTCVEYVRQYPQEFVNARFEIDYMRIYSNGAGANRRPPALLTAAALATGTALLSAYLL